MSQCEVLTEEERADLTPCMSEADAKLRRLFDLQAAEIESLRKDRLEAEHKQWDAESRMANAEKLVELLRQPGHAQLTEEQLAALEPNQQFIGLRYHYQLLVKEHDLQRYLAEDRAKRFAALEKRTEQKTKWTGKPGLSERDVLARSAAEYADIIDAQAARIAALEKQAEQLCGEVLELACAYADLDAITKTTVAEIEARIERTPAARAFLARLLETLR